MLVSKNIVCTLKRPIVNGILKRSYLSTPPRNRVPVAEKLVHGIFIAGGIMAIPLYVATNIKNYKEAQGE